MSSLAADVGPDPSGAFFISPEGWLSLQIAMARFHHGARPMDGVSGDAYQTAMTIGDEWLGRRCGETIALSRAILVQARVVAGSFASVRDRLNDGAGDAMDSIRRELGQLKSVTSTLESGAHALAAAVTDLARRSEQVRSDLRAYNALHPQLWEQLPDDFVSQMNELATFLARIRGVWNGLDSDLEFVLDEASKTDAAARLAVLKVRLATTAHTWSRLGDEAEDFTAYAVTIPDSPARISLRFGENDEGGPSTRFLTMDGGAVSTPEDCADPACWFLIPCADGLFYLASKSDWTLLTATRDRDSGWLCACPDREVRAGDDQKWQLVPAGGDRSFITSTAAGTCLAAENDRGGGAHVLPFLLPASSDGKPHDAGTANLRWSIRT